MRIRSSRPATLPPRQTQGALAHEPDGKPGATGRLCCGIRGEEGGGSWADDGEAAAGLFDGDAGLSGEGRGGEGTKREREGFERVTVMARDTGEMWRGGVDSTSVVLYYRY